MNKELKMLEGLEAQFRVIEKALLKAKKEGRKTITKEEIQSPKDEPAFYDETAEDKSRTDAYIENN